MRALKHFSSFPWFTNNIEIPFQGSFTYKLPADDVLGACNTPGWDFDSSHSTIIASTLLGSIVIFIPISRYILFHSEHFYITYI